MTEDAKRSLCWNCKHGICVKETTQEIVLPPMMDGRHEHEVREEWQEQSTEQSADMTPIAIEQDRVKAICFWRPAHIKDAPPILVANIQQCNRFEKKDE